MASSSTLPSNSSTLPSHEEQMLWSSVLRCRRKDLAVRTPAPEEEQEFRRLAGRRLSGEPLQYLTGIQGFRTLELQVGPGVFVPRPETEMVVERCLQLLEGIPATKVVDIGTGSGAIALAIAAEKPDCEVWAVDSDEQALRWAQKNVAGTGVRNVHLLHGDLFGPLPGALSGSVDLVVSNPPYLSEAELAETAPDVRDHEPRAATVAGPSGMEMYSRLAKESSEWLRPGGRLVLETAQSLWGRLRCILAAGFTEVRIGRDLAGRLRVAEGKKR